MVSPLYIIKKAGGDPNQFQYGESVEEEKIVIGDWHEFDDPRVESLIEQLGFMCYFEDQITSCHGCGLFVYLQPGFYGDLSIPVCTKDELLCHDCVKDCPEDYLDYLTNNPDSANHVFSDSELEELGLVRIDTNLESGLHEHMNDDPKKIYKKLKDQFPKIIFSIDNAGQFHVSWSVWIRREDSEIIQKLESLVSQKNNTDKQNSINNTVNRINEIRAFIQSDKFTGIDLDGSRKDWISTNDMDSFLLELRDLLSQ